ncbi:hypothetical protein H7U32_06770 [Bifidobacterium pullorum subsp. saeculare]|uniref:Membrane-associated protein n=1 Tax=Bifidobacterium pullorum subsp. saeculare TaxID=78257 RepID=A0A939BA00_9BIFI|nr:hypothetical protein [Bifidobacterium pullorum]MBM6700009.1 hypothetical protein [Bifidobacterium pullorum subsp. saeculare]
MSYASLSAVVVLVIIALGIVVWLPARTASSMRHVEEHRADRFSPSMHLVDESSGTRFSDGRTPQVKGILMEPQERRGTAYSAERIAHVRALRHAAVRRRRIIVLSLLAITLLVLGLAFGLKFSPLFALIPAALLVLVLALGAHAASQARAWEHKVAEARRAAKSAARAAKPAERAAKPAERAAKPVPAAAAKPTVDAAPTEALEKREIRRVLHEAELERVRREQLKAEADAAQASPSAPTAATQPAAAPAASHDTPSSATAPQPTASAAVIDAAAVEPADASGAAEAPVVSASADAAPADATTELSEITPARAIEAFDMVMASQDLISFSLGAPRNGVETPAAAPESLEIKSARQVAKAEPVDTEEHARLAAEAKVETEPASAAQAEDVRNDADRDTAAFHDAEAHADVEAPAASSDSLGTGLESILARRGAAAE